ncbi:MAG TPA: GNAT family protein [Ktedonobacterales bacterium]|nr:GNAT family protein [Ktedonobacterales bacterium]
MPFTFRLMDESDARAIQSWRYEGEYAVYNAGADGDDGFTEMLDRRSPYYAVRDERGELIGFFCYGTSASIGGSAEPGIYTEDRRVLIGLGLRPDLTGKGLGLDFVNAGLAFGKEQFAPATFGLYVMTFNQRAIRVYERAGFQPVREVIQHGPQGERPFLEMRRNG